MGGHKDTKYRGPSRGPSRGPALTKFFFRVTREEILEKLRLCYVKTYVQCAKQGGGQVSPSKNSRPPLKERKFVLFLRKLIKNNLFSAPIAEQFIFHKHCKTSAVFYKRL